MFKTVSSLKSSQKYFFPKREDTSSCMSELTLQKSKTMPNFYSKRITGCTRYFFVARGCVKGRGIFHVDSLWKEIERNILHFMKSFFTTLLGIMIWNSVFKEKWFLSLVCTNCLSFLDCNLSSSKFRMSWKEIGKFEDCVAWTLTYI